MATVTVFTAARMAEIEDQAITDARIDGYNLIVIRNNLQELDLGNVRGPIGLTGPQGPDGNPTATILEYAGTTLPTGYLWCDGAEYPPASFPDLFAEIGTTYGGDGVTKFAVPDRRNRVALGVGDGPLGATGGTNDAFVVDHNHTGPNHRHQVQGGTASDAHTHTVSGTTATTPTATRSARQLLRLDLMVTGQGLILRPV